MNEGRKKLTIAIPTYNRANSLKKSLKRIMEICKGKDIEIIVSDNASTDNTQEIVDTIKKEYPQVKYFRNSQNLGFDGNFLNCFDNASSEYVWLISDDDYILDGALEAIEMTLTKNPVCVHLNSLSIINEKKIKFGKPRFDYSGDIELFDKNEFIEKINIYCTFISSLIFNVDYVKNVKNKERYFGTNILQSHILFNTMINEGCYIINTFPCVAAKSNNSVGYDVYETWIKSYSELLLNTAIDCGFDRNRMECVLESNFNDTIYYFVLKFRQTCVNESSWNKECIWEYIGRFPRLEAKFSKIVNCPKFCLKYIDMYEKIGWKINAIKKSVVTR